MISSAAQNLAQRLRAPGYIILGIAMILPILDFIVSTIPLKPTTVVWRFGAFGLLSSAIGAPLLVLLLIYALALLAGDRKVMILVAVLAALIALTLIGGSGAFALCTPDEATGAGCGAIEVHRGLAPGHGEINASGIGCTGACGQFLPRGQGNGRATRPAE